MKITTSGWAAFKRGDYVSISGREMRVLGSTTTTFDVRKTAGALEPVAQRIEDWVLFPLEGAILAVPRLYRRLRGS